MCGILGYVGHRLDNAALNRAIQSMRHRGPDGSGSFRDDAAGVGLGHARLSIIDLGTGAQPLFSEDHDIALVCNGEIYDFERIRNDLSAKGHTFRTGSDSEVIIHLYQEYGDAFVEHLRGEFAFLLYDSAGQKLVAVRDRFGIKPLFFHATTGNYLFASEAKAIFATGVVKPRIDVLAIRDYFCGVIPDSIFEGIAIVPPGCMMTVDLKTKSHRIEPYWDLYLPRDAELVSERSVPEHAAAVRTAFDEAVRLRLRADVPVGVYLSGGIDSAIVAATAARHFPGRVKVFNIEFPGDHAWNEYQVAKNMAEKIGAEFHSVRCDSDTLLQNMVDCLWITELPFANFHGVGKYLLSRLAREHVTVVLTGEGSDELFLGYVCFQENKGGMSHHIADRLKRQPVRSARKLQYVIDALGFMPMPEHSETLAPARLRFLARMFGRGVRSRLSETHPVDMLKRRIDRKQTDGNSHARQVQYYWIKSMLAPYLLCMLGDRAEMGHSIEGRTPFLDHHLFELTRTIPDGVKIHDGIEKHVLREAFRDDLTNELYHRAKWPYSAPPMRIQMGQNPILDALLNKYLSKKSIELAGIFSYTAVRSMLAIARWLPFEVEVVRNTHSALLLILTVQILDDLFVQNFEASYETYRRSVTLPELEPAHA
ncbi:MAG: asparagine synthase (glutamine-hydrolyzing) [Candidatus Hydrogenedentes bacterium]|nr:asparagine synthase (glutamine-hydrolyzing) [Candidatus Hydrogenedentota bacterium]